MDLRAGAPRGRWPTRVTVESASVWNFGVDILRGGSDGRDMGGMDGNAGILEGSGGDEMRTAGGMRRARGALPRGLAVV